MQDDVQVLLACSPGTCLIRQTVSMAAVREETPQGKPFEYKYSISPAPVFVKPGLCCASETEVTLPGHKCSKSRESGKSSVPLCTQFSPGLKRSCMMVRDNTPGTLRVKESCYSFATSLTPTLIMRDCATPINQLWDP